jgi:hypothetical protein
MMPLPRFAVIASHREDGPPVWCPTHFHALDTHAPEAEQPAIVRSWSTATEPRAATLAHDWVRRQNIRTAPDTVPNYYSDAWEAMDRCVDCGVVISAEEAIGRRDRCRCCDLMPMTERDILRGMLP